MATENDRSDAPPLSLRGRGWSAHVPTALLMALVTALNGGTCTAAGRIETKVDDLSTRVARLEGAFTGRVALHGAEGAGGTGALPGD